MTITTVTSRKILPTTLAAALAGLLMVSGCTKQAKQAKEAQTLPPIRKQRCKTRPLQIRRNYQRLIKLIPIDL